MAERDATIAAIWNKIDTTPHAERAATFLASLPILADAYDEADFGKQGRFARWLYEVAYLEPNRRVRFACEPAVLVHNVYSRRERVARASLWSKVVAPDGLGLWTVTGLQPALWRLHPEARKLARTWPKKHFTARHLFARLYLWSKPVLDAVEAEKAK